MAIKPTTAADTSPMPQTAPTYEAALSELEAIVTAMESGQMPLDSLLGNYRRASDLLALCRERLRAVEDQVRILDDAPQKDGEAS
jgi:exodeoxyribonuclease VII small subunit